MRSAVSSTPSSTGTEFGYSESNSKPKPLLHSVRSSPTEETLREAVNAPTASNKVLLAYTAASRWTIDAGRWLNGTPRDTAVKPRV